MKQACDRKTAIVTGASRGIGAAIARRLAAEGARVAISARTFEPEDGVEGSLVETAELIGSEGGTALPVQCDLSSTEDRHRLVAETNDRLGPVDILVNNAAVTFLMPLESFTEKRFKLMVEMQLWAPFELAQLVVPQMKQRGQGWILNISSRAAVHPEGPPFEAIHTEGNFSVYGTVKAGLNRMTTALAAELLPSGIAVNALAPWDNVATPGAGHHDLVQGFALEAPEVMAEAAVLLCTAPPERLTGRVAFSQPLLAEIQRRPPNA